MARFLPSALRRALLMPGTADGIVKAVTVTHDDLASPIRVVSDRVPYAAWQGEDWQGLLFKIGMLSDTDAMPRQQIELQNVDRMIGDALRSIVGPARLLIQFARADDFDQSVTPRVPIDTAPAFYEASHLFLVNAQVNAGSVTADVVGWDYTQSTYPGRCASQDRYPGAFR